MLTLVLNRLRVYRLLIRVRLPVPTLWSLNTLRDTSTFVYIGACIGTCEEDIRHLTGSRSALCKSAEETRTTTFQGSLWVLQGLRRNTWARVCVGSR